MSRTYALPKETNARIDGLVDEIERSPFGAPTTLDLEGAYERLNIKAVVDDLPEGLDEEDLRGILMLAMLTECATDSYADVFYEGARDYGAPWLGRFTERTWVPDEYTHADPFKSMLMSMGHSEAELDDHMKRVQEKTFVHSSGRTPVELTTFGMIQEFLTDHWHGMIAGLLQRNAPEAAYLANEIKKRETLHYMWYREMTAMQVQANPDLLHLVAETVTSFSMPGMSLIPEYQSKALEWMKPAGADMQRNAREVIRHLYEIGGSTKRAGELLIDIAVIKGISIAGMSPTRAQAIIDRLGGAGYSLLGEAVLECVGLPMPDGIGQRYDDKLIGAVPTPGALYDRLRAKIRTVVVGRLDLSSVTGAPAEG